MEIATFNEEKKYLSQNYTHIIGIDEAGRGPLAGPVVAAACVLRHRAVISETPPQDPLWDFVRDSKRISEKKRAEVFLFVKKHFFTGVGIVSPETIDRMNILQATFLAMKIALTDLKKQRSLDERVMVLVDGSMIIPHLSLAQTSITKGDTRVKSIAAASIIAKVTRDTIMQEADRTYPSYGFGAHKGYGTKAHMDALHTYGATPIHRKSFAPVKKVLAQS